MPKKEFIKYLDKNGNERLRVKIETIKGKLADIVFQYESFIDNKWREIVRYDCAHGYFHRDIINPKGNPQKTQIAIEDLKLASSYAEQDLKDRWEWYKERYITRLKNDK